MKNPTPLNAGSKRHWLHMAQEEEARDTGDTR